MVANAAATKRSDGQEALEMARAELREAMPKSTARYASLTERPAMGTSRSRFWPVPFFVDRASGAHLWDIDGNDYVDCNMGHGPLILGHAHPAVVGAIRQQLTHGVHYGPPSAREAELAELVAAGVPGGEHVAFTNSGGESTMAAVRIARAATGRETVAKVEGGLHGNYEPLLFSVFATGGPDGRPDAVADCAGLSPAVADSVVMLPFDDRALDIVRTVGDDLACVVVEPVQGSAGALPPPAGFLEGLRAACTEVGALLIFDEVITGFRLGPRSGAGRFGVTADLTALGKAIGGGLPCGAVCGPAALVDLTNTPPGGAARDAVFVGGTFSGNPLTAAAGVAQLSELLGDPANYERLESLGARMRDGLAAVMAELGVAGHVTGIGSLWGGPYFMASPPRTMRDLAGANEVAARLLSCYLQLEGVLMTSPPHLNFVSTAHSEDDVDRVVAAHRVVLKRLQQEGWL